MDRKWIVKRCRSGKRWAAWKIRSKRKSGMVFDTWKEAFMYAYWQSFVESKLQDNKPEEK